MGEMFQKFQNEPAASNVLATLDKLFKSWAQDGEYMSFADPISELCADLQPLGIITVGDALQAKDAGRLAVIKVLEKTVEALAPSMVSAQAPEEETGYDCHDNASASAQARQDTQEEMQRMDALISSRMEDEFSKFREALPASFVAGRTEEDIRLEYMAEHFNFFKDQVLLEQGARPRSNPFSVAENVA